MNVDLTLEQLSLQEIKYNNDREFEENEAFITQ